MQMNNKAPQNIQNLFKDVSSQLKPIFKILNWQESQKKAIVEYKVMIMLPKVFAIVFFFAGDGGAQT